jgi:hypothetical protein
MPGTLHWAPELLPFGKGVVAGLRVLLTSLLFLSAAQTLRAQANLPGVFSSRSVSGQFLIQSAATASVSPLAGYLENDTNFIRLDPTLLTVSCERIKQLVCRELGANDPWKGKIFLRLYPTSSPDDSIAIESEQYRDGWQYHVSLPVISHRERYVRAIVAVLLLEMANRQAREHPAELPLWLTEGIGQEIWTANAREVILPPPQGMGGGLRLTTMQFNSRQQNPLQHAHEVLSAGAPMNFEQLSWPAAGRTGGDDSELYRSSAQLFVHQLLNLPNGAARLRTMLSGLSRFYNWQFAFLNAFEEFFHGPVDVEKWWSLQLIHFTGRGLADAWSAEESWQKLDECVRSAVQVRIGTNELPLHAEISLQTIIREWPNARQGPALETKLRELQMLRPRLSKDLANLTSDYCRVIETYVAELDRHGFILPFRKHALQRRSADETFQQLDQLDARRASMQPALKSARVIGPDPLKAYSP